MAGAAEIRAGRAFVELYLKNNIDKGIANARKKLDGFAKSATAAGQKLVGIGVAAAIPFAASAKTFADFDDAMRLVGAVSQSTEKELAMLTATAKRLGATTSFTAIQVAGLMGELGRAGFSAEQVNVMTGAVLNLARATGTDATLSAGIMAASIRQFGLSAGDAAKVADLLTVAANASFNSVESLGEALTYAGPVAADFNMSMEDTLAILGALGNVGIQGSNAGTALRRMLTLTGAEAEKLQGIFGVAFVDAAGNARPLVDVLDEVNQATANLGTAERAKKFNEAFGLLGITGASAIAKNAVAVRDLQQKLQDAAGTAEATAKKMDAGLGGSFRIMMSAIEGVAIAVGESLAPMLSQFAKQIETAATAVIKFVETNRELVSIAALAVGGVVAVGAGLITAGLAAKVLGVGLGLAGISLMPLTRGMGLLRMGLTRVQGAALGVAKSAKAMGVAMLAGVSQAIGHLGRIGTGAGQVAVGFAQIGKAAAVAMGPPIISGLQTAIRAGMAGAVNIATATGPRIAQALAPVGARIAAYIGPPIRRAFSETMLTVSAVANGYIQRFAPVGAAIASAIGPYVRKAFIELTFAGQAAAEKIRAAWGVIAPYASSAVRTISSVWRATAPVIASNLVRVVGGAFNRIRAIGMGTARAIAAGTGSIGRGFGNMAGGIGALAMMFGGAGGGALGGLLMAVPLVMSLVNPLTIIVGLLGAAAYGWVTFGDGGKKAFAGVMSVLQPFIDTAKKGWSGISQAIKDGDIGGAAKIAFLTLKSIALDAFAAVGRQAKPLVDLLVGVWDVATTFWHTAVEGLKSAWTTFVDFFSGTLGVDLGGGWADFAEGIVAMFTQAARAVTGIWQTTVTGLAKMMLQSTMITGVDVEKEQAAFKLRQLELIEKKQGQIAKLEEQRARAAAGDFSNLDLDAALEDKVRAGTATQEEILADIDEQLRNQQNDLQNLRNENTDLVDQANAGIETDIQAQADKFRASLDNVDRRAQERTQAEDTAWMDDAAKKAQKDLDDAVKKKTEADKEAKKNAAKVDAAAAGTQAAIKSGGPGGSSSFGSFSAAALGLVGNGGIQQQQLAELRKARKEAAEQKRRDELLNQAVKDNQLLVLV